MLTIRLLRQGKQHQPSFKIVVIEKGRSPRSGKFLEQVGFYNPRTKEKTIKSERIQYWISKGAQPSNTAHNFFIKIGIIKGKKIAVHSKGKKKSEEKPKEGIAPVTAAASTSGPVPAAAPVVSAPAPAPAPESVPESVPEPAKETKKPANN